MIKDVQKTILVVDDIPQNLDILKQILSPDYHVKVANNGSVALKVANDFLPDLILLDIRMPDMDGYEVCKQLKSSPNTASIPVIFVTTKDESVDEMRGFDVGAVDYITKPISAPILKRRVATHLSLVRAHELYNLARDSIQMLGSASHYNDDDTGQHIYRMSAYSRAIAKALGWHEEALEMMELGALMHDTGKIGIPDNILKKSSKGLSENEWKIMKTHSEIGYNILSNSPNAVFQLAAEIALNHHERWDGQGYPRGIKGEDIPESARIVAVADVFDALTSKRPYKDIWPVDKAITRVKALSGSHFEPRIIDAFLRIIDEILEIKSRYDA